MASRAAVARSRPEQPTTPAGPRRRRTLRAEQLAAEAYEIKVPEWERKKVMAAGDVMREKRKALEQAVQAFWRERLSVEFAGTKWEDVLRARYPEPLATNLAEWGDRWVKLRRALDRHIDLLTELQSPAAQHREQHVHNPRPSVHEAWLRRGLREIGRKGGA
jgi:hypothetical protein